MSSFVICPDCKRKLRIPTSVEGKPFRCPVCKAVISTGAELDSPSPSRATKTTPSPKSAATSLPRSRPPREEEPVEDLELEEEKPVREKPRRKGRPIRRKSSRGLIVGLVVGGVGLLLLLGIAGAVFWAVHRARTLADAQWQTFTVPGGDCTVLMPGVPVPHNQNRLGVASTQYLMERNNGKEAFMIQVFDVPQQSLRPNILDDMVKGYRIGILNALGGKVTSETTIALGDIPGRECQIKTEKLRGTMIGRMYIAKLGNVHRAFMIGVGGESIQPDKGDAVRFFDSFKITAPVTAPDLAGGAAGGEMQPPPAFDPPPANRGPRPPQLNPPARRPRGPSGPF